MDLLLLVVKGVPKTSSIEFDDVTHDFYLANPSALGRFPRPLFDGLKGCHGTASFGDCYCVTTIIDFIEQRETFCLELASADDSIFHKFTLAHYATGQLTS